MKNRLFAGLATVLAIGTMAFSAYAATPVHCTIYGLSNGAYVVNPHSDGFLAGAVDNEDGTYTVNFKKAQISTPVGTMEGWLTEANINGDSFYADGNGAMKTLFEYIPTEGVTKDGEAIEGQEFQFKTNVSSHSVSQGMLVFE